MRPFPKTKAALHITLTAIALSTFALAPLVTLVTADAAYAKGGNGNGGGNGGGNGHGNGGGHSDKDAGKSGGEKHKSEGVKSKTSKGETSKTSSKHAKSAKSKAVKTTSAKPKQRDPLHASQLGKLNGAIHSSPNAKLAHIRNGNLNGPVGMAAGLALADYTYAKAQTAYTDAVQALDLASAFDLINNAPTDQQKADAQALLDNGIDDGQADLDAQSLLDYPDLTDALAMTDGVTTPPTPEEIAAAQATADAGEPSRDAVTDAESALLASYKGTLDPASTAKLLEAIRASLPTSEQIADVLAQADTAAATDLSTDPTLLVDGTETASE